MNTLLFAIITVLTTGGTYNLTQMQTALTASNCGDEIQVEAGPPLPLTYLFSHGTKIALRGTR